MKESGIGFVVEPAVELESNSQLLELAQKYPDFVYPAVGVHPTRSFLTEWKNRHIVDSLSSNPNVIAIGELGLDYHYSRMQQHRIKQFMWFIWQLKLADRRQLPLVLHIRLADKDAIHILRFYKKKLHGGVCHCFTKGVEEARICTKEFGFYLGIGGALLQEDSEELARAVKDTPLEFIILETDGPYVKPTHPAEYSN